MRGRPQSRWRTLGRRDRIGLPSPAARMMADIPMKSVTAIILAAGEGKRMRSRRPKVLHRLCGRPLIGYPLRLARTLADRIVVVVPPDAEEVRAYIASTAARGEREPISVEQPERLG